MRLFLLTASLIATLGLTSCADHVSRIASADPIPQDPIGPGDGSTVGGGSGGGSLPSGGDGQTGGGTSGGGTGSPSTGGSSTDGGKGGGQGGNGPGSSPVPEPGTMLLVGTGLAGAALMRRRRKIGEEPAQA